MFDFSEDVFKWLLEHNWYPDRRVAVPPWITSEHPAYCILTSFGELALFGKDGELPDNRLNFAWHRLRSQPTRKSVC